MKSRNKDAVPLMSLTELGSNTDAIVSCIQMGNAALISTTVSLNQSSQLIQITNHQSPITDLTGRDAAAAASVNAIPVQTR
jgi:hypothetical protein